MLAASLRMYLTPILATIRSIALWCSQMSATRLRREFRTKHRCPLRGLSRRASRRVRITLAITLTKNLPVAAGLGGGSANAAAVLRMLRGIIELPDNIWTEIALSLGADVPVCLLSQSAHMTGIGEGVTPLNGLAPTPAVLVNPLVPTPTGAVFKAFDSVTGANAPRETPRPQKPDGDMLARTIDGRNDLEPPAIAAVPIINDVLRELSVQTGAQIARMSGSGASCFALFERGAQAQAAAKTIASTHPDWWVKATTFGD